MALAFTRVCLSADDTAPLHFLHYWPMVATAWRRLFPGCKPTLAYVGECDDVKAKSLSRWGEVFSLPVPAGSSIPSANWAKVARYILAGGFPDDVCVIHDIDSAPLQTEYGARLLRRRLPGHLLCVGAEVYKDTHPDKFPTSWMCAEGSVFSRLFARMRPGMRVCDEKEDLRADPSVFSDESLIRALLKEDDGKSVQTQHVERGVDPYRDWIDRSWWLTDVERLHAGQYESVNFIRPLIASWPAIRPVAAYIFGREVELSEVLP